MGAIFLFRDEESIDINQALEIFTQKHFSVPHYFKCGRWTIYSWSKIDRIADNYVIYNGITLIAIGTPIYKGFDYSGSLNELVKDFYVHSLDQNELIGHYTLFFIGQDEISVLCDPLGTKHLFIDRNRCVISSSFLAIACAIKGKLDVDKCAVYEKLLTGFIMAPRTIYSDIRQVNDELYSDINQADLGIRLIGNSAALDSERRATHATEIQCISGIMKELEHYFRQIRNASGEGIDVGISGGYDSRLILSCMNRYTDSKIHLHSHATENDHNGELKIARRMAEYVGVPCHTIPTRRLNHIEDPDWIMKESVLFFDGRTSFAIGGCGEVYTADYRKQAIDGSIMTLTGVGGELFRNVFNLGWRRIKFDRFMRQKVFSSIMREALDDEILKDVEDDIIRVAAKRLGIQPDSWQGKEVAHRYYCEIMMPDGQGNVIDAYNQLSCCTAPFLEPSIIRWGYKGISFHGTSGDFEGKLIDTIDKGLASIDSTYGYPINKRPGGARVKEFIRAYVPDHFWQALSHLRKAKTKVRRSRTYEDVAEICGKGSVLQKALSDLYSVFPEIDFSSLRDNEEIVRRLIFLSMTFYYVSQCRERMLSK